MIHTFDTEVAKKYGVHAAVLLQNIVFWIAKNAANDTNYIDGYYWTYNSASAMSKLFPYLTKKQVETALGKLRDDGIILAENHNADLRDRTLWYTITPKGMELVGEQAFFGITKKESPYYQKGISHVTKKEYGCSQTGAPLPDINTDKKQQIKNEDVLSPLPPYQPEDEKSAAKPPDGKKKSKLLNQIQQERFNRFWATYPRKISKGQAEKTWAKIDPDDALTETIIKAIGEAKQRDSRFREERFTPHPSTWLNGAEWENQYGAEEAKNDGTYHASPNGHFRTSFDQSRNG